MAHLVTTWDDKKTLCGILRPRIVFDNESGASAEDHRGVCRKCWKKWEELQAEHESFGITVGPFAYNIAGSRGIWGKHPTEKDSRGNPINVRVGKLSKGEEHLGQIIIDALNREGA